MRYELRIYRNECEPKVIDFKKDKGGAISAFKKTDLSRNDITEAHLLRNGDDWMAKYLVRDHQQ